MGLPLAKYKIAALRIRFRLRQGLLLAALWLAVVSPALAANFVASLDRDTVAAGESATLTLTFEGQPTAIPQLPSIANLNMSNPRTAQSFHVADGRATAQITYSVSLTPAQPGEYTIPPIHAVVDGTRFSSQPLKLTALRPGSTATNSAGEQLAMLRLSLPKEEVYVGEVVTVLLQLCIRDGIANTEQLLRSLETFGGAPLRSEDFTILKHAPAPRQRAQIGNAAFNIATLVIAAAPRKTGVLPLDGVTANFTLQIPQPGRRSDFFGFFQQYEERSVSLAAETRQVTVRPLPQENVPASFAGAVGNFSLTVTASPTNVAVGDPINVRVQLTGRGTLNGLQWPEQPGWAEFRTYPPTAKVDHTDVLGIEGTKTFEQALVPQNTAIRELPAAVFSFFNPEKHAYESLTHPAIPLTVRPSGTSALMTANGSADDDSNKRTVDIVGIKQRLGTVAGASPPLVKQTGFLAAQAIPVAAFLVALAWRRRRDAFATNPRLRRQRQVTAAVRSGMNALQRHAADNNPDAFFATLFRLLQEQLGERLDLPASAITEAVIDERLRPAGIPNATLAKLHELFQMCNLARYAPVKTGQELAALIPAFESSIQEIRRLKLPERSTLPGAGIGVVLLLANLCIGTAGATAAPAAIATVPVADDFERANTLYEQGRFGEAAERYESLLQRGTRSPAVLFNLGNAQLKAGEIGRAIAAYRQAQTRSPRDPDLRTNLDFARSQVQGPGLKPTRLEQALMRLTLNEWTILAATAFWTSLTALALAELRPAGRTPLRRLAAFAALTAIAGSIALTAVFRYQSSPTAIVISNAASVRNGPLDESPIAFPVRNGAEMRVLDSKGVWLQVSAGTQQTGWIRRDQLLLLD